MFRRLTLLIPLLAGPALSQEDAARQQLRQAVELQQSGRLAEAVDAYRDFLKSYPEAAPVRSNLGAALAQQGHYAEAIPEYSLALKSDPSNSSIRFNLALALYKAGEITRAVPEFEALSAALPQDDPTYHRIALLLSECYIRQGKYDRVIALLDPIPNDRAADYLLGTALLHKGETKRGTLLIQRLLENGDTAEAHMLMAYTQLKAKNTKDAMLEVDRALQLNPNLPEAYSLRGRLAYLEADMVGAEESFQKAAALDPANFDAHLWLGTLLREESRLTESHQELERALLLRPDELRARFQFAKLASNEGDDPRATALLEALEKDSPNFIEVHRTLATIYFRLGRPEDGRREREIAEHMNAAVRQQDEAQGQRLIP